MKVRCISLWQPWASLMACGAKFLETRDWDTKIRGEVYIHASKTLQGIDSLFDVRVVEEMEDALGLALQNWETSLPFGALIAKGRLVETLRTEDAFALFPEQSPFGNFGPGRFAHRYENLQRFTPIPLRGAQGFFFAELGKEAP